MYKTSILVVLLLVACKGDRRPAEHAPAAEAPAAAEEAAGEAAAAAEEPAAEPAGQPATTDRERCLRLLAAGLGVPADARPYEDRLVGKTSEARTTETLDADTVELRGEPATLICVAWKRRDDYQCTEESLACDDEEYHDSDTRYIVAAVARGETWTVTDQRVFEATSGDRSTQGALTWTHAAIGPEHDALILTRHDESGDTSLERVSWVTVAGGKLVDQLSYRRGVYGGMTVAEVEHEVLEEAEDGRFPIRFRVKIADEEHPDAEDAPLQEDTCRWSRKPGTYLCAKNLLEQLSADIE